MNIRNFNKFFTLLKEHLSVATNFIRLKKYVYDNGDIILIFYHSTYTMKVRMYVIDSKTQEHIETYIYDPEWHENLFEEVKKQIKIIQNRYDKFRF